MGMAHVILKVCWLGFGGGVGEEEENKTAYSGVMQVHGSLHFLSLKLRLF